MTINLVERLFDLPIEVQAQVAAYLDPKVARVCIQFQIMVDASYRFRLELYQKYAHLTTLLTDIDSKLTPKERVQELYRRIFSHSLKNKIDFHPSHLNTEALSLCTAIPPIYQFRLITQIREKSSCALMFSANYSNHFPESFIMDAWMENHKKCLNSFKFPLAYTRSDNKMTQISSKIGYFMSVPSINYSNQRIMFLPSEIGQLKKLQILNLEMNRIAYMPDEIGMLENLFTLNLASNRLKKIPEALGKLPQLKALHLKGNPGLMSIPLSVLLMPSLEELHVDNHFEGKLIPRVGLTIHYH